MGLIGDSSELKEAKALLARLLEPKPRAPEPGPAAVSGPAVPDAPVEPVLEEAEPVEAEEAVREEISRTEVEPPRETLPGYESCAAEGTRAERLESALGLMCERGGFESAALVGGDGFLLASHDVYYGDAEIARLCTSMSDLLDRLGLTVGAPDDVPMTVSLGGVTACIIVIEANGEPFVLAGFSTSGHPDPHELSAAAGHMAGLLD